MCYLGDSSGLACSSNVGPDLDESDVDECALIGRGALVCMLLLYIDLNLREYRKCKSSRMINKQVAKHQWWLSGDV